jgi:DNA polymerase I-like protein with 3'-5' exonuclease and polymerase domains
LGAQTGRFSSSDPNLQNVGRGELRACFVPAPGCALVIADYSQIELRVVAAVAKETKMLAAYASGADLHKQTASLVLGKPLDQVTKDDRQLAKAVNFGLIYGQSSSGLVKYAEASYGVKITEREATEFRDRFFKAYPNLKAWHDRKWRRAKQAATEVRTVTGRRRLLPTEPDREWQRFTGLVNTPVQGGAADGMKLAMIELAKCLPEGARIVSTVHDELLIEVPRALAEQVKDMVRDCMVRAMAKLFPQVSIEADVKVASNWGEK